MLVQYPAYRTSVATVGTRFEPSRCIYEESASVTKFEVPLTALRAYGDISAVKYARVRGTMSCSLLRERQSSVSGSMEGVASEAT
jgi:hypothetical protein